ncbi:hypothetical protein KY289_021083 [Solanum tuberosum]|nr:hypothetical protein KY289_021083 [Solanum tuberosum]
MIPSLCYFIQQKGLDKIEDLESRVEVLNLEEAINTLKGRRSKATRALYLLHDYLQEDTSFTPGDSYGVLASTAETISTQPQAVEETLEKPSYTSIFNPSTCTQKSDGKLPLKLKPVIYVHGEPTVSFNFSDLESYIQEENLQYALVAKFSYGRPDMIDLRKIFTRHFEIKGDCNLGLLDHRHVLMFAREAMPSLASAIGTSLQVDKATTDKSRPSVARITEQLGTTTSGSSTPVHIDVEAQNNVDNNLRQLIVTSQVAIEQLSSIFVNDRELGSPNSVVVTKSRKDEAKKGNTTVEKSNLDKQIEQTGKLKQCCHDEHTNQQALVTHENEFTVTEKIDGKEINPNTPTMFILDQKSASRWADLVEEENHTPSPSRSKLSPQTLEFVPTSKANSSMAVIGTSSNLSATKVNMDDRDFLYDLDNDMSDGDDEDEMLDICFDKVAKEGDLSPRQQIKKWKHQMQKEDT